MDETRTLRSDARRRREALLEAAIEVFGQEGIDAPLETIADRAGVGRATLYRNFPDRPALILATLEHEFAAIETKAHGFAEAPDGLFRLLDEMAGMLVRAGTLGEALRQTNLGDEALGALRSRIRAMFVGPIARAQAAGLARPDLTADDATVIVTMLGAGLRRYGGSAPGGRAASLLIDGLRGPEARHG